MLKKIKRQLSKQERKRKEQRKEIKIIYLGELHAQFVTILGCKWQTFPL